MGKGQRLYIHAKTVIPGGTQLLSKRPEMFLPDYWPAYYNRAKGCEVWDLDNTHYYDMSFMGIGANNLGYAFEEVDDAAKVAIDCGGMCTLNAPEEVYLADKLLAIHTWAGGVRYTKAGGEAMALAVRVARAHTRRDIILFCGYHGWHDWYLSANIGDKDALGYHHLSGLEPLGVPQGLRNSCFPFHYNNIDEFRELYKMYEGNIAAIVMEPIRNDVPIPSFMDIIVKTSRKDGIVLIFDEITAGFRLCSGGSHLVLGYEPDIAVFAKGMTNGYPLAAIIGRKEVMEAAQGTFISSTFFTERVALAASLKAIEVFERERVWEKLIESGKSVKTGWLKKANECGVSIKVGGIDPLAYFSFEYTDPLAYKTFYTQEMLKRGFLASTAFYASYSHTNEVIEEYIDATGEVFDQISQIVENRKNVRDFIKGDVCHAGFARLI